MIAKDSNQPTLDMDNEVGSAQDIDNKSPRNNVESEKAIPMSKPLFGSSGSLFKDNSIEEQPVLSFQESLEKKASKDIERLSSLQDEHISLLNQAIVATAPHNYPPNDEGKIVDLLARLEASKQVIETQSERLIVSTCHMKASRDALMSTNEGFRSKVVENIENNKVNGHHLQKETIEAFIENNTQEGGNLTELSKYNVPELIADGYSYDGSRAKVIDISKDAKISGLFEDNIAEKELDKHVITENNILDPRLRSNSQGLTLEQVQRRSLRMIGDWDQPLINLPEYDPNFSLTGGAKLMPISESNQAFQRNRLENIKQHFGGGRPEAWHIPVSQGINDSLMMMAFKAAPGKFMAAQAAYAFGNSEVPYVLPGLMSGSDWDFRGSLGVKNSELDFEIKAYGGTDFDLAASWKSGKTEIKGNQFFDPKLNNSTHIRWTDVTDISTLHMVNIGEIDTSKPIDLFQNKRAVLNVTPGIRVNGDTGSQRNSFNFKLELPKSMQPAGWSPYIGFEIRK